MSQHQKSPFMFNKTSYFVLPLVYSTEPGEVGLSTHRFGEKAFGNAFLSPDFKCVIVRIDDILAYTRFAKTHSFFRRQWHKDEKLYLEFFIPTQFHNDVLLFVEGKYSSMSEIAIRLIRSAIKMIPVKGEVTPEEVQELQSRIGQWPHLTGYQMAENAILPEVYISLEPVGSELRAMYKKVLEERLGVEIPEGMDLYTKIERDEKTGEILYEVIDSKLYNNIVNAESERSRSEYE